MSFVAVEVLGRVTSLTAFGLKRNFIVVTEEDNDQKEALLISVYPAHGGPFCVVIYRNVNYFCAANIGVKTFFVHSFKSCTMRD